MHKSVDVLRLQQELGGVIGVCCQKVSEAEVFARAGINDVLVSNQVRDPAEIDRLARLPRYGARIVVCVDDLANVNELSAAAQNATTPAAVVTAMGTTLECFVEIDCGAGRCGDRKDHRRCRRPQIRPDCRALALAHRKPKCWAAALGEIYSC
jgi:3-hydroxy-D-aspartate aldolase